ncbi:MAG TPA: hypothetical protein VGJ51_15385, partial [Candidatus Angelobacter sp.]
PEGHVYYRSAILFFGYVENWYWSGTCNRSFTSDSKRGTQNSSVLRPKGTLKMTSGGNKSMKAAECADRAGKHAFGLNDNKAVTALRKLADDIEAGTVVLNSVTTSSHATHEEFTVREIVIEVLEEYPLTGPRMVGK